MSASYWQNRWIDALVQQGMDRDTAAKAYETTYGKQPADQSKSPEIQALMTISTLGNASAARSAVQQRAH